MATVVGFSVRDIFAGIQLVRDIIIALNDSRGSSSEHRALITELYGHEKCLIEVENLQLDSTQQGQLSAIRAAACQSQVTLDAFGRKLRKYQPHLCAEGSGSLLADSWKKVKCSLIAKKDIERLRAELCGHTGSLSVLLMTIQMKSSAINFQNQEEQSKTIAGRIQEGSFTILGALKSIGDTVTNMLETTARILRINLRVDQTVLEMHKVIIRLPGQLDRDEPVYLLDARGRMAPSSLNFVTTKDAFLFVLKERFKDCGVRKIEREEFSLVVRGRMQPIDLRDRWETWFSPGQRVDMSMLFEEYATTINFCPSCKVESDMPTNEDVECSNCGIPFRRISEECHYGSSPTKENKEQRPFKKRERGPEENDTDDEDVRKFHRVTILARQAKKWHYEEIDGMFLDVDRMSVICKHEKCWNGNRRFGSQSALLRHVRCVHMVSPLYYQCRFCEVKFRRKDSLVAHTGRIHMSQREELLLLKSLLM